ncbi:mannose-1-phosphate guanyltransferase [alpha proteobacterium AAP38]|nr:mannose-1-phosphate guanyltransferase [alpha proteobacterium AAP38]
MSQTIIPVILSGGSGTRLWPLSREQYPKQFLPLAGSRSLLQQTVERCLAAGLGTPILVGAEAHRFVLAEQFRDMGVTPRALVLEPAARNTAPAIAAATLLAREIDPDALLLVLPADHVIRDGAAWAAAVQVAAQAAAQGHLVTFGIKAETPETGFGWIRPGAALDGIEGAFKVDRFVEKPALPKAEELLREGCSWNSGMFLFAASAMLEELTRFEPALLSAVAASVAGRASDLDFVRLAADAFKSAPSVSIDDAIFARTERAATVPCSIGWSDVGSWSALHEVVEKDGDGNATRGDVILRNCQGSYVRTDGVLTAVLGLSDVVVVATSDAILVAHKDAVQDVKGVVHKLKADNRKEAESRPRVYRPWGYYQSVHAGDRFQVKRITVKPGHKLSLQKHFHRAEHWIVVNGTALVTRDGEEILVRENESIYLPLGAVHRLENPGKVPLNLIEVQSGSYLGEDDIVRLEDTYGRA